MAQKLEEDGRKEVVKMTDKEMKDLIERLKGRVDKVTKPKTPG